MHRLDFDDFPQLQDSFIELKPLSANDQEAIFELRTVPEVNKYLNRPIQDRPEQALQFIHNINKGIQNKQWLFWGIHLKGEPYCIGTICLWNYAPAAQAAEIGYELRLPFQGKGYMNKALRLVLAFAFEQLQLKKIEAYTHQQHKASISLLTKNGFELFAPHPKEQYTLIYQRHSPLSRRQDLRFN